MPRSSSGPEAVGAALLLVGLTVAAAGQGTGYPKLSRDQELRLAISAGPLTVSQHADIYVMGQNGFEKAIAGDNGWACIVVRSAQNKTLLAPHCLNPNAVKTVLPAFILEGSLQASGWEGDAINAEVLRQFESGEIPMPAGPAYAYMLSKGQRIGPNGGNFKPHFMLYVPYANNASIGGDPKRPEFPFVGPFENHPLSTIVIIMEEFVDPATVTLPSR
jgi:hypothetical protein